MMFKKEIYDVKFRAIFIFLVVVGLFFLVAPFQKLAVSMLREYSDDQSIPEIVRKLMPKEFVEKLNDWSFFIYSQWFGKNLGQIIPIIAVIMAFPLFAREYENGTIEFLLARNDRRRVFFSKTFVAIFVMIFETMVFSLLPVIYSLLTNKPLAYHYAWAFMLHTVVGAIFWFTVALFLSTVSSDQVKPLLGSFAAIAATTVLGLLKPLRFLNVYSYIMGTKVLQTGKVDLRYTILLSVLSCTLVLVGYKIFKEKEI